MKKELLESIQQSVQKHRDMIFAAERQIWRNPETGYKEWKTQEYLLDVLSKMGYQFVKAGNIPGFYTDIDTGRPGPHLVLMAELDSVLNPGHPECDPQTGAVHACGHNCQCAAMVGVAAALKEPGMLEGLCGKIRIMFVPAEELIELDERKKMIDQGIIRALGGKCEFLLRGYLDDIDIAVHMHTITGRPGIMRVSRGSNGNLMKMIRFTGKGCHAGGPADGINALMAANLAVNAINAIRETFREKDYIRYNTIVTGRICGGNQIPDCITMEGTLRASSMEAFVRENKKLNRCIAAAAAAVGAKVQVQDLPGYVPLRVDDDLREVANNVMVEMVGSENVYQSGTGDTSCTDVGDVSSVMPVLEAFTSGLTGIFHGDNMYVTDQESAVALPAIFQVAMIHVLLGDEGKEAKRIIKNYKPIFSSVAEYAAAKESLRMDRELVEYEDGQNIRLCL